MSATGKAILVVDDEPSIVEALGEILAHEGHLVSAAPHGRAALDALAAREFDLVLMDVMMPVMGGVEAVRAMRADATLDAVPVILMSAGPIPELTRVQPLRKPFTLPALLRAVDAALAGSAGRI